MFTLHPTLQKDTLPIGDMPLCRVLLMNNRLFPWLILVPMRDNLRDLIDVTGDDEALLWNEIKQTGQAMKVLFAPDKLNIASLGNMVAQLHIHIIARFTGDKVWPNPVWGGAAEPYSPEDAAAMQARLRASLPKLLG